MSPCRYAGIDDISSELEFESHFSGVVCKTNANGEIYFEVGDQELKVEQVNAAFLRQLFQCIEAESSYNPEKAFVVTVPTNASQKHQ